MEQQLSWIIRLNKFNSQAKAEVKLMACQTQTFAQVTTSLDGLVRACSPKSELHQKLPSDCL